MARLPKHALAPSPLRAAEILPWIRSLCTHLSEGLARLPRPSTDWLPRSAPAWLRQVVAALLRLLGAGGPAQAASAPPTAKKAPRRRGKASAGPGTQGGDAGEGEIPAASEPAPGGNDAEALGRAGAPTAKKAPRRGGKAPAVPGTQEGDAGEEVFPAASDSAPRGDDAEALGGAGAPTCKKGRRRRGKTPTGPGPQGDDVGEGPCTAASNSAPGGNDAEVLGGDGAPSSKKARRRPGKTPAGPRPQGGEAGEGACSAASDFVLGSNDASVLGGDEAPKTEPAAKNSLFELGELRTTDPGTKEPLQEQEEEGWEVVKRRKTCRGGPNFGAETSKLPQEKCCTYCTVKGHLAKDCPRTKASINLSTSCDPRGKGHYRKSKDGGEDLIQYKLKKQSLCEDEKESEAHRMYREVSNCKKGHILCLACHLKGDVVPIQKNYDVMKTHFKNKHSSAGTPCERSGCLARAETKRDIGLHQDIYHKN